MSLITRTNPLRLVAKRNISMAMSSDLQAAQIQEQHQNQNQNQHHNENQTIHSKTTQLTVSQLLNQRSQRIAQLKKLSSRSIPSSSQHTTISITPLQVGLGSSIRECLMDKDHETLFQIVKQLTRTKVFDPILQGLTRHEITLLFKTLINAQLSELKLYNDIYYIASKEEKAQLIAAGKDSAHIITSLYTILLSHTQLEFTPYEYEMFLKLEVENYRYPQALDLLTYIDTIKIPKTINIWNMKLRVLGDADPGNWTQRDSPFTLSKRGIFGGSEKKIEFGTLLTELSEDMENVIPNMETHKLILLGAGKNNNLELVRHHIKEFWGISPQGETSEGNLKLNYNSPLYPDIQLMETLVGTFGVNNQLFELMHYVNEFQTYYNIDLSRAHHFWKLMITFTDLNNNDQPEVSSQIFESIWTLVEKCNVSFNVALYERRRLQLVQGNDFQGLIKDMKLTREHIAKTFENLSLKRCEKLLTNQYRSCCKVAFKTSMDEKFDLVELSELIALDSTHLKTLRDIYAKEYKLGTADRKRFEDLQKEYDEQDDEDSLW